MISIAMATYNGEKYLREQLDSILAQTYTDFELVICDDCSTDNTVAILREYEKKDNRIKVFENDQNLGFKKNFEKVVTLCTGEYTAFSDQDDICLPNKLELLINNIGEYSLICSDAELIDKDGKSQNLMMMKDVINIEFIPDSQNELFTRLLHSNIVQGATILAETEFLKKSLPIPECFKYHDWWFGLSAVTFNGVKYLQEKTLLYRQHGNNQTKNEKKTILYYLRKSNEVDDLKQIKDKTNIIRSRLQLNDEQKRILESYYRFMMMDKKDFKRINYIYKNYEMMFLSRNQVNKVFFLIRRILGILYRKMFRK